VLLGVLAAAALLGAACSSDADSSIASTTVKQASATTVPTSSTGCAAAPSSSPAPGDQEIHTTIDGQDRWFIRHVPTGYTGTSAMPLVVDIHGYGEGARLHAQISDLSTYGDQKGFVTITPQGQGDPVHWDTTLGSSDLAFIKSAIDQTKDELCIDPSRVFATGYSNGAFMTSSLACQYSDQIAAVAPVAGMRDVPGCKFKRPVPAIAFHGTEDQFVEYQGGLGPGAAALTAPDGSGRTLGELDPNDPVNQAIMPGSIDEKMPDITRAWAKRDGCETTPAETKVADDVTHVTF
jgi:polyhydroxybutyrate depolymerase